MAALPRVTLGAFASAFAAQLARRGAKRLLPTSSEGR
jgi:hypothetical protein